LGSSNFWRPAADANRELDRKRSSARVDRDEDNEAGERHRHREQHDGGSGNASNAPGGRDCSSFLAFSASFMMRVYRYLEHLILNLVTPFACTRSSKARRADGRVRRSSIKWRQHEVPGCPISTPRRWTTAPKAVTASPAGRPGSVPCGQAGQRPLQAGRAASPDSQAGQPSNLEDLDGLGVLPPGRLEEVAELGDLLGHSDGGLALVASPAAGGGGTGRDSSATEG